MRSSATVKRVVRGQLCTGCGLCASIASDAIKMKTAEPGYRRPEIVGNVSAEAEGTISSACPGAVVEPWDGEEACHRYWGPWRSIQTGYATDAKVRHSGSSGGVVTALALHALRSGVVDRVVHVGADPSHPTRNLVFCSSSEPDILDGAGSRYAASSPLEQIDRILNDGGAVAFVGKPCDVSGLRRLGRVDPRVGRHVPLMLSFFCAGVPSYAGANRILDAMGVEPDEVQTFRYRGEGWPGKARAVTRDGAVAEMSYADSWGGFLSKEVQFRCKICPDGVGGVADIACADAWHGDDAGYPSFDEQDGRSLIIARTDAGERHLAAAVAAGQIVAQNLNIDKIDTMQPSQARRKRQLRSRLAALTATIQPKPLMQGTMVREAASNASPPEELKSLLGTVRRIVLDKR